jgi:hypothetical protein
MEKTYHFKQAKHAFKKEGANLIANLVLTNIDGHEKSKSNMYLLHCSELVSLLHNIGNLV